MNKQPKNTVNVGRQTLYGNPIKKHVVCPNCDNIHSLPGDTLGCYRNYLINRVSNFLACVTRGQDTAHLARLPDASMPAEEFRRSLLVLEGKELWCPGCGVGSETCHAHELKRAIRYVRTMYEQGIFGRTW